MALQDFRAIYLPYCIEQQEDQTWLILNREYSPVGLAVAHMPPGALPVAVRFKGLGPALLRKLSVDGKTDSGRIYLYNDRCNPIRGDEHMRVYLRKLALLAKLEVV